MTGDFESLYKTDGSEGLFGVFDPKTDYAGGVLEGISVIGYVMDNPEVIQSDSERILSAYQILKEFKRTAEDPKTTAPCLKEIWTSQINPVLEEFETKFGKTIEELAEK